MPDRRFKKCILHIGTEKTGTKAIQNYLRLNRRELLRHGILYPVASNADNASQWEFVAAVHKEPWNQDVGRSFGIHSEVDQVQFIADLKRGLELEFANAKDAHTLLISCEHFQSRLVNENLITRLRDWFAPWVSEFQIVVYFRRQDRLSHSLLSTRLKSSVRFAPAHLRKVMRNPTHYYNYFAMHQKWANVFGSDAISARIFEQSRWVNENLIQDFNDACGIPNLNIPVDVLNPSLNRQGFHFLRALNDQYPILPGDQTDPNRAALVRRVAELFPGKFYPISRAEAEAFYRDFESTNEKLRKVAFPDFRSPLFDEDFSDYPETAEPMQPSYADAVDVAVKLWENQQGSQPSAPSPLRRWIRRIGKGEP